ncbi:MAG: helix-turn-helix transcriptional regulator [Gemmatimonadaceae bacterium]
MYESVKKGRILGALSLRVPGFDVTAGVHAAGSVLPAHEHSDPTLCYVLHGRFTEYSRGRSLDCVAGTLKLTAAGETHSDRFPHAEAHGVRIDIDRARFADSAAVLRRLDDELFLPNAGVAPVFDRMLAEVALGDDAASLVVEGLLLELLGRLARDRHTTETSRHMPAWLRRADELVHASFAGPLTLSQVARDVGVDASTLSRAYRAAFGVSVGVRVRLLRVEWAARELATTAERISVIALQAGFCDQAHFTNVFRRVVGTSPARYRQLRFCLPGADARWDAVPARHPGPEGPAPGRL